MKRQLILALIFLLLISFDEARKLKRRTHRKRRRIFNVEEVEKILKDDKLLQRVSDSAFKGIDKDNSGLIDEEELEKAMDNIVKDLGEEKLTKEEFDSLYDEVNTDKKDKINKKEFKVIVKAMLEGFVEEEKASKRK